MMFPSKTHHHKFAGCFTFYEDPGTGSDPDAEGLGKIQGNRVLIPLGETSDKGLQLVRVYEARESPRNGPYEDLGPGYGGRILVAYTTTAKRMPATYHAPNGQIKLGHYACFAQLPARHVMNKNPSPDGSVKRHYRKGYEQTTAEVLALAHDKVSHMQRILANPDHWIDGEGFINFVQDPVVITDGTTLRADLLAAHRRMTLGKVMKAIVCQEKPAWANLQTVDPEHLEEWLSRSFGNCTEDAR